jgi:hypothetical protein
MHSAVDGAQRPPAHPRRNRVFETPLPAFALPGIDDATLLVGVCPEAICWSWRMVFIGGRIAVLTGVPAPPQVQVCSPPDGRSGWFSHTQP